MSRWQKYNQLTVAGKWFPRGEKFLVPEREEEDRAGTGNLCCRGPQGSVLDPRFRNTEERGCVELEEVMTVGPGTAL